MVKFDVKVEARFEEQVWQLEEQTQQQDQRTGDAEIWVNKRQEEVEKKMTTRQEELQKLTTIQEGFQK